MNIRFYESLCKANEENIKLCKQLVQFEFLQDYKVINGSVRIKKFDYYKFIKVKHPQELYDMFKDFFDYDNLYLT